jgi:putative drug exporter of the RND superfamily
VGELLGRLGSARPRLTLAVVGGLAALAFALAGGLAHRLQPYGAEDPASESARAKERLERATGAQAEPGLVALVRGRPDEPRGRARLRRMERIAAQHPLVAQVRSAEDGRPELVSRDRRLTALIVRLRAVSDRERQRAAESIAAELRRAGALAVGGRDVDSQEINRTIERDLRRAEAIALPIIFVLSLWFFRGLVAALMPPLVGILAIALSFLAIRTASELTSISVYALNLVTALGLGLAIDYTLLIVSRYREELAAGGAERDALRRTLGSAGRTVAFSSLTVAAALAALTVFPQRYLYSMGLGGAVVAVLACLTSLVVVPAVLVLLGRRINSLAPDWLQRSAHRQARPATSGGWYRLSRFVMRRPAVVALASAAVLLSLASPFARVELTAADKGMLPAGTAARRIDDKLRRDFLPGVFRPLTLVLDASPTSAEDDLRRRVRAFSGVAGVGSARLVAPHLSTVEVRLASGPLAAQSQALVRRLRAHRSPVSFQVTGDSAAFVDQKQSLRAHLPLAASLVAASTLLLLFLMTGSVVLPVKTLVLNALTVSAAFGAIVLVFQDGRLEGLLGYQSPRAIDISQPLVLAALVFGLSTDYGVFLLERIREARARGFSDRAAVPLGLERTGRIVTAAALLFSVAIGSMVSSSIVFVKEASLGTALGLLIDATLVRALLVPALMALLQARNWWSPAPLRRLHRALRLPPSYAASPAHD